MIFEAPVKHFPAGTTTDELKKSGAPSPFDRYLRRETGAMEKALGPPGELFLFFFVVFLK